MSRLAIAFIVLAFLTACNANNEAGQSRDQTVQDRGQVKTRATVDDLSITKMGTDQWKDSGLRVEKATATDIVNSRGTIPSEPDMEREEKVLNIVKESEKYIGKKMDNTKFIQQVYSNAGYKDFKIINDIPKANNNGIKLIANAQPGDVVYFDLNGDSKADHYAIKLGNGDIIHAFTDGKVRITDIEKEKSWKSKVVYIQKVF